MLFFRIRLSSDQVDIGFIFIMLKVVTRLSLFLLMICRWSLIAQQLPGRTDNDVKNYWNTKLKKKLSKMGIDPLTHKPFSQIISEIGNIRGNQNPALTPAAPSLVLPEMSNIIHINGSDTMAEEVLQNFSTRRSYPSREPNGGPNQGIVQLQSHLLGEVTSSCSSSSSLTSVLQFNSPQDLLPFGQSPFSWSCQRPSLLDGTLQKDNGKVQRIPSSSSSVENGVLNGSSRCGNGAQSALDDHSEAGSPSCLTSFVEAILERDSKMRSEFPQLLDGFLDY